MFAQTPTEHRISVAGSSTITVLANQASFTFEVEGLGSSLREAVSRAHDKANTISVTLQQLGVRPQDVRVGGFKSGGNLDKAFFSSKRDFSAQISVSVTVTNMSKVADAMFAVSDAQPVSMTSVEYSVQSLDSLRTEALLQAAANAKLTAQRLAAQLGLTIQGVIEVEEVREFHIRGGRAGSVEDSGYSLLNDQSIQINGVVRISFAI